MDLERDRTSALFHKAYEQSGQSVPPTVKVKQKNKNTKGPEGAFLQTVRSWYKPRLPFRWAQVRKQKNPLVLDKLLSV